MFKEALLKAGIVDSEDVKRVERQQRIEVEQKRKRRIRSETRQLMDNFPSNIRNSIKSLRKRNPKVFTNKAIKKLADVRGKPWLMYDPEIVALMSYITVESMRLDFQKLKDGAIEKIVQDVKNDNVKMIVLDSVSTALSKGESNGKM